MKKIPEAGQKWTGSATLNIRRWIYTYSGSRWVVSQFLSASWSSINISLLFEQQVHTRIRTFDNNNWKKNYHYYFKVSRGHSAPALDSHQRRFLLYTAVAQFVTAVQFSKRFDLRSGISSVHNDRQFLSHYDRCIERIVCNPELFGHIVFPSSSFRLGKDI